MEKMELTRMQQAVLDHARSLIGTPYRHQGRNRRGMDCVGPLLFVTAAMGMDYQETDRRYGRNPEKFRLKQEMDARLEKVRTEDIRPGDILLFGFGGPPQHVGIATDYVHGGLGLVHCNTKVGRVVEHALSPAWRRMLKHAYRLPEPAQGGD